MDSQLRFAPNVSSFHALLVLRGGIYGLSRLPFIFASCHRMGKPQSP